ncbi:MAG: MarR family transcriptional regulator [Myxococcales bacterium]|nr:MAG: MarR family transcriptional regulator [Myxococcales bacterium]
MQRKASLEFLDSLAAMSRSVRARAADAYAGIEVGPTQAKFLRYVGASEGISQAELARATQTDPALTGRALESLIARGWVRRKRSEEDRRQYVLELSPAGKRMKARVEEARQAIAERLVSALSARDLEDFERIQRKVVAAFGAASGS